MKAVLLEARTRPAGERASWVAGACGDDAKMREEVLSLLAHESAPTQGAAEAAGGPLPADTPERVGPYRVIEVLGRGGMGVVYRALQETPIRREVALKLIAPGMDNERVLARFDGERQALAWMDHPGIAHVLDAGTAGGRPYFVMELVRGEPITDFCVREGLSVERRIDLFLAVCAAVQHAHQKGIIHRDLKPSNILVTRQDGVPIPKVIDFGIAKAVADGAAAAGTSDGLFVGTPDYMSPEQATGAGIDTRSDVYSLGVLLYELLTGARPYRFREVSLPEILRIFTHEAPPRPSTVTGPAPEQKALRGDLDNIVLKALEKKPPARYASVEQLADDLRRHLDGRPVQARPPTRRYRAGKFVRRHRFGVAAAAVLVVLLAGFAISTAVQSARVARERDRALLAEQRAQTEAATAQRVSQFMVELFRLSDPSEARGNAVTAREILDKGAARLAELNDQPEVQATLTDTVGRVYQSLGLYGSARTLLENALATRRRVHGNEHPRVAESLDTLARLVREMGDPVAAEPLYREALAMNRKLLGEEHPTVALNINNLANLVKVKGNMAEAETLSRRALEIRKKALGPEHPDVAESLHDLGSILLSGGDYAGAEALLREALALDRRLHGDSHPVVVIGLNSIGGVLARQGDYAGAESAYRESLFISRKLFGEEHPFVAHNLYSLGALLQARGDLAAAEPLLRQSLDMHRRLMGAKNRWVADGLAALGRVLRDQGALGPAEAHIREAIAMNRAIYGESHASAPSDIRDLASVLEDRGDHAGAEALYRQAVDLDRARLSDGDPMVAADRSLIARALLAQGDLARAEPLFREALHQQRKVLRPRHPATADTLVGLGRLLLDRGDAQAAEPLLREGLEIRRAVLAKDSRGVRDAEAALARCRARLASGD